MRKWREPRWAIVHAQADCHRQGRNWRLRSSVLRRALQLQGRATLRRGSTGRDDVSLLQSRAPLRRL
ncbi:hypothetical protein J6590_068921 [Homalodisca vitripennis]|nr:hypothetical protein J6590_068921 [Homalodisca vitripennis]